MPTCAGYQSRAAEPTLTGEEWKDEANFLVDRRRTRRVGHRGARLPGRRRAASGKAVFRSQLRVVPRRNGQGRRPGGHGPRSPNRRDFSKAEFKFDTDSDGKPGSDADIRNVVQKGAGAYGGSMLMAPWPTLSDDDVANVIVYIRTLKAIGPSPPHRKTEAPLSRRPLLLSGAPRDVSRDPATPAGPRGTATDL